MGFLPWHAAAAAAKTNVTTGRIACRLAARTQQQFAAQSHCRQRAHHKRQTETSQLFILFKTVTLIIQYNAL